MARARSGGQITSSASTPSCSRRRSRRRCRRSLSSHSSRRSSHVRPTTVRAPPFRSPSCLRWSITSGTPPARKTRTVGWFSGPFGRASTRRGTARFTRRQSAAVGRTSPAACATAGTWIRRFVEPPNAACASIAFSSASCVRTSASVRPSRHCSCTACAVRRATSSQIGCPDGASAACGTVSPKASATTWAVAAVPRNWQPPPGRGARAAAEVGRLLERTRARGRSGRRASARRPRPPRGAGAA